MTDPIRKVVLFAVIQWVCLLPVSARADRQILVILDGFRPDYLSESLTPNLHRLKQEGVWFENHHAAFPTVTRANAATFSTGVHPGTHGLLDNTVYFPEVDPTRGLSTANRGELERIHKATGGNLLTAPTLGEILQNHGMELAVFSAGSPGSCFLLNHKVSGGALFHYSFTLPESLHAEALEVLGPEPKEAYPNRALNERAMTALIEFGLKRMNPEVLFLWLSDPDHTAHRYGMGSELTEESIRLVDSQIGRLLEYLESSGQRDRTNLLLVSDHGFSTHLGRVDLSMLLASQGLKTTKDSTDIIVSGSMIYVRDHDPEKIQVAVRALQQSKIIGAVFTRPQSPGDPMGWVEGTLSFDLIQWNHDRSADILVSNDWDDEPNEAGWRGRTWQQGVAGHGTSSPWDIHNTLLAVGPDFRKGSSNPVPSGNVDIAPTILHLCGIDPPKGMEGRILREAMLEGPDPMSIEVRTTQQETRASGEGWVYHLELLQSHAAGSTYLDETRVRRSQPD